MRKTLLLLLFPVLLLLTQPIPARDYTISQEAIIMIKRFEACRLTAYRDAAGWSIGYGHHGDDVTEGMTITQQEADELFRQDILKRSASVRRLVEELPYTHEFHQGFIDGLFSLVYNCGENRIRKSEFYRLLKECRPYADGTPPFGLDRALEAIKTTAVSAPGHVRRRQIEYNLMLPTP